MKTWQRGRKRIGPVTSAHSSTSRQRKPVMPASLRDPRVSEAFPVLTVVAFNGPDENVLVSKRTITVVAASLFSWRTSCSLPNTYPSTRHRIHFLLKGHCSRAGCFRVVLCCCANNEHVSECCFCRRFVRMKDHTARFHMKPVSIVLLSTEAFTVTKLQQILFLG